LIAICGSLLFSDPSESEIKVSCETLSFFYRLWEDSAFGKNPNGVERAAWIIHDSDGRQVFQKWRNSGERNRELWEGAVPADVVAVVHTHPAHRDSRPSPADKEMAKLVKIHVYVISKDGLWMSNPDEKISRVLKYVEFKKALNDCAANTVKLEELGVKKE
jgi:hypothetical protein